MFFLLFLELILGLIFVFPMLTLLFIWALRIVPFFLSFGIKDYCYYLYYQQRDVRFAVTSCFGKLLADGAVANSFQIYSNFINHKISFPLCLEKQSRSYNFVRKINLYECTRMLLQCTSDDLQTITSKHVSIHPEPTNVQ